MKGTYSPSIGVCVFSTASQVPQVVFAPEFTQLNSALYRPTLSLADDWEAAEFLDADGLIRATRDAFYLERARSLIHICLSIDDAELLRDVLQDIEDQLATDVGPDRLIARLLLAPLADTASMRKLGETALSLGLAATANTLNRVVELQPLLRRFVGYWLGLPEQLFASFSFSRKELWATLVSSAQIPKLLEAGDSKVFSNLFATLLFTESNTAKRKAIVSIARELAKRLGIGGHSGSTKLLPEEETTEDLEPVSNVAAHLAYQRAMSQVEAIVRAVGQGKDQRAIQIMEELVTTQATGRSGATYANKSLCNIAKQCADMFRTDFERMALEKALALNTGDDWTLVQFGDHLKRVGDYRHAEEVLKQVINRGSADPRVAASALADVCAQQGEFQTAIEMYKSIPDWETSPEVRTAIADNLRRQGLFDAAREAYDSLESQGFGSSRTQAGKAEIAKRLGDLQLAEATYRKIIADETDQHDVQVHKLALVGVLKQQLKLDEAYRIVESLIAESPFLMSAKLLRAAILGLMDQEQSGLESLPDSGKPRAYREWLQQYYRGLLLLKLGRYDDAKTRLMENLDSALLTGEEREILRLAAAHALLAKDEIAGASQLLARVTPVHDRYVEYLRMVLQYHLAVAQREQQRMDELRIALKEVVFDDENLSRAVTELLAGDVRQARRFELKAFLALAA